MRLFVAVSVPEEGKAVSLEVADRLRSRIEERASVRWVTAEHLHLTVRFIGHVDDRQVEAIRESLVPALRLRPFDVALHGCGVFPERGAPRVIWLGVSEGLTSLRAIHDELDRRLLPLRFTPETRPFSAHLTLGRIKEISAGGGRLLRAYAAEVRFPPVRWRVSGATVFESVLSPNGPTYRPLWHVPCAG